MSEPYVGEIKCFSFNKIPRGWAACNGQLLQINQNQALFTILGTTYGGDGVNTFALPDLRGRVPVHFGNDVMYGESGGEEAHTLTINEMPMHTHVVSASTEAANTKTAAGNVWAVANDTDLYNNQVDTIMSGKALSNAGSSRPHPNMQPYNVANYCIALVGIYPSRN